MPPTAIVDADLSKDGLAYYVVEDDKIWKAAGFGGGAATWEEVAAAASLPTSGGKFLAVRCSKQNAGVAYALAVDENGLTYCGRTNTAGLTWTWNEVATQTGQNYTVTYRRLLSDTYTGGYYWNATTEHTRIGDDVAAYNPLGLVIRCDDNSFNMKENSTTINNTSRGGVGMGVTWGYANNYAAGVTPPPVFDAVLANYFGAGNYSYMNVMVNQLCPKDAARIYIATSSNASIKHTQQSWVFWDQDSYPQALAVSPVNDQYVYIGTQQGIFRSVNGGFDWVALTTSRGANDLLADWAVAGAVYFWSTDGKLGYYVDTLETLLDLTEPSNKDTRRLGRYGTDLWAITGGEIKKRSMGAWTTQKSGLVFPRGLQVYQTQPQKLAFVDMNGVWYSADSGATWADKKGSAATFGNLTVHLTDI